MSPFEHWLIGDYIRCGGAFPGTNLNDQVIGQTGYGEKGRADKALMNTYFIRTAGFHDTDGVVGNLYGILCTVFSVYGKLVWSGDC